MISRHATAILGPNPAFWQAHPNIVHSLTIQRRSCHTGVSNARSRKKKNAKEPFQWESFLQDRPFTGEEKLAGSGETRF